MVGLTINFQKLPQGALPVGKISINPDEGLTLTTKDGDPLTLAASLSQFPPRDDWYRLTKSVQFVLPEEQSVEMVRVTKFDAQAGGL